MKKKKIIALGASLVLMLAVGMTASAGHHGICAGRVIQSSGLCQYRGSHEGGHHLFWHDGGGDCAYWGIDVRGVCDNWEDCHGGAGTAYGQPAAAGTTASQLAVDTAASAQPTVEAVPESQPEPQTGYAAGSAGTETYGSSAYPCYNGTGYCYGGHHGEWGCNSGNRGTGCHGSGHHSRGHH